MFKIIQEVNDAGVLTDRYTVICYVYNKNSHSNVELYRARNFTELDVTLLLQGRSDKQLEDTDFAFVIVKSGNGPAIITDQGNLMSAAVKKPISTRSGSDASHTWRKRVLSSKRRKTVSH